MFIKFDPRLFQENDSEYSLIILLTLITIPLYYYYYDSPPHASIINMIPLSPTTAPKLTKLYTQILKYINSILANLPLLQDIDKKYSNGVNGRFTLIVILNIIFINVFVTDTCWISIFFGFYYPAMRTIRTIKSTALVEYHRWATYWLIFISTTIVFRYPFEMVLGYLPYFELWKMGFYLALFHPKFDLAYKFYLLVVKPLLKRLKKQQKQKEKLQANNGKKEERKPKLSENLESTQTNNVSARKYSDASVKST